tara:strand:- start:472 stop:726 length:255 start_codon:yes stop_codon:yes gene_type:complete
MKRFRSTVFIVIEKVPKIRTVSTKNSVSGRTGARIGSAMFPSELRIFGLIMRKLIRIMTSNIVSIEPFGGGGGGGDGRLAMEQL